MKQREKLKRLVLDRDNAQQNFHKAQKAQNLPNANPTQASAKVEATREEYDQATYRMEQCKVLHTSFAIMFLQIMLEGSCRFLFILFLAIVQNRTIICQLWFCF